MMQSDGQSGPLDEDVAAEAALSRRFCCFWIPWSTSGDSWARIRGAGGGAADGEWWRGGVEATMKLREWSELVAGPRWKTFIRRFGRSRHSQPAGGGARLNYDPLSYALNFDDGNGASPDRDFTSRFAVAPPPAADLAGPPRR